MTNPDQNVAKSPDSVSLDLDSERKLLAKELSDPTTTPERLEEIHNRAQEIADPTNHDSSHATPISELTDDQLGFLLIDKSTPIEVLEEISRVVNERRIIEPLPTATE